MSEVISEGAIFTTPEYVKVTNGQGGPTVGVAKMSSDGTADVIMFPDCPEHGLPFKFKMSLGLDFPISVYTPTGTTRVEGAS